VTVHEALEVIYSRRSKPSACIERWVLRLQPYDFKVCCVASRDNIADALSRLTTIPASEKSCYDDEHVWMVALKAVPNPKQLVKMKERLKSKVLWPGVDKDAEQKFRECYGCQLVTKENITPPVKTTKMPERPWQDIALDLLGSLPTGEYLLVLVDYFSRWVEVDIIKSTTSVVIIKCLDKQFSQ